MKTLSPSKSEQLTDFNEWANYISVMNAPINTTILYNGSFHSQPCDESVHFNAPIVSVLASSESQFRALIDSEVPIYQTDAPFAFALSKKGLFFLSNRFELINANIRNEPVFFTSIIRQAINLSFPNSSRAIRGEMVLAIFEQIKNQLYHDEI